MKYLCKLKQERYAVGLGNTLEEAIKAFEEDNNGSFVDLDWFTLSPIKVKLVLSNEVAGKNTTVKGVKK